VRGEAAEVARAERAAVARFREQEQSADDELKMQALSALMQMDAEVALPILKRLMENRSEENATVRRRAVFIVAQSPSADRESILLDALRNDPDQGVRENAAFHLSQAQTPEVLAAFDSILQSTNDNDLQQRAMFALSQHRSARAGEILRDYAGRDDVPRDLRVMAIQSLGQRPESSAFLRDLYSKLREPDLKETALFALSQTRDENIADFLLSIAMDDAESAELRTRAVFWFGQMRIESEELFGLYDRASGKEMKAQLIHLYAQRPHEQAAIEKLIAIVRNETDQELQSQAIFWLGQTRDPRAIAVLEEIINR